ncbi:S-adenosyl-L-methionine-dependent methyltransferase [Pelagophyceae sp. CCMP2097]|nr:S-adenosyl-L-methionine-dependent methyltransferase [Pelagophyceae sp. CCMP2097]
MRWALLAYVCVGASGVAREYEMDVAGCTPRTFSLNDLKRLLESQRTVWEEFGTERPWWSVLSSEEYDGQNLSTTAAVDFYATGAAAVYDALQAVDFAVFGGDAAARASSPHLVPWGGGAVGGVALDFGCGVGRLAAALATKFSTVICVDHSATHLDVARTSIARLHPSRSNRVVFVPTEAAGLEAAEAGVDFALSLLTLQHAVPQVQVAALEHMCDALRVGGLGYAQLLTFYEGSPYVQADCDPARAIGEPGMHLHFLPLAEATRHLAERGCAVLATSRCDGHVRIPNRNSESHCVTFAKLPTRRPEI